MRVSVILCTYSPDMYDHFREAAESVLCQTYEDVELVVIVDGDATLCEMVTADFGEDDQVVIHCNQENRGLSFGRNKGVELASGEVVAFIDDDAVADERWVEELVGGYDRHAASAVGGRMAPRWVAGKPAYVPEEFYFLFGVTYRGFPTEETAVRNTFSSNLSFRRDVFTELGGFSEQMGKRGGNELQGGETELCARLYRTSQQRVIYVPSAVVEHRIFAYRTELTWLLRRAFWQGYSKQWLRDEIPTASDVEWDHLRVILSTLLPQRVVPAVRSKGFTAVAQVCMSILFTVAVGVGFGYAWVERDGNVGRGTRH